MTVLISSTRGPAAAGSGKEIAWAIRAELDKALQGRLALVSVIGLGVLMSTVTSYGLWEEYAEALDTGAVTGEFVTSEIVRAWMMVYLFAGICAAQFVSREFRGKVVARSVLAARSRGTTFVAKLVTTVAIGLGFGCLAVIGAIVSAAVWPPIAGGGAAWSRDAVLSIVGIVICCVAAAIFGGFVAWLLRHQVAAVALVIVQTMMLEPAVQRLWPEAGSYLFTIALSSVYRDSHDGLMSVPGASVVVVAWLAMLGVAAWLTFRRKDVA